MARREVPDHIHHTPVFLRLVVPPRYELCTAAALGANLRAVAQRNASEHQYCTVSQAYPNWKLLKNRRVKQNLNTHQRELSYCISSFLQELCILCTLMPPDIAVHQM